jgi:GNAT superfamily N-acetyltransferase
MTSHVAGGPIEVRLGEPSDRGAVLGLLSETLDWSADEHALFSWKHDENPFGASPTWVALDGDEIVGLRTFMRWEHRTADGEVLRAVRAVDTATRPSHQGRGIFRRMTLQALDDLRAEGVAFVFNTPNDNSRPGYMKMGWTQVGRLPASVRVTSLAAVPRMARARVPADVDSTPATAGRPAADVLAAPGLADLLAAAPPSPGLHTNRTPDYLRWRYGYQPLAYRAVTLDDDDVRAGVAVFRLRRRGAALECALCDVIVPAGDDRARRALVRSVTRQCGADYVIRIGGPAIDGNGFVRAPRQGPILVHKPVTDGVPGGDLHDWSLTLGDVELF